jgi:hypothetical protein
MHDELPNWNNFNTPMQGIWLNTIDISDLAPSITGALSCIKNKGYCNPGGVFLHFTNAELQEIFRILIEPKIGNNSSKIRKYIQILHLAEGQTDDPGKFEYFTQIFGILVQLTSFVHLHSIPVRFDRFSLHQLDMKLAGELTMNDLMIVSPSKLREVVLEQFRT